MENDFTVAVFISGRGSNLRSLLDSQQHFKITHILSNKAKAPGLAYGKKYDIRTSAKDRKEFPKLSIQKEWLYNEAEKHNPSLIVLAGYMQLVEADFTERWHGKMVNIHPSLLPEFPGLDTHKRALEAEKAIHGCSVHYVDETFDTGPIIAQAECEVLDGDTPESLAARVLELEHQLLPWSIAKIAAGQIWLDDKNKVQYSAEALKEAEERNFRLMNDTA